MKCYKKEDLKKIGYYRTEEQLQERLKELDCYCVLESGIQQGGTEKGKGFLIGKVNHDFVFSIEGFKSFMQKNKSLEFMNSDGLEKDYVSEDEVSTYLSEQGYKVEELFHVTKENIKFITNFYKLPEKILFPNWIEKRIIEEPGLEFYQEKIPYSFEFDQNQIYLTFKERIGCCTFINYRVNFGNYIALISNGRLKEFSGEEVKKSGLEE